MASPYHLAKTAATVDSKAIVAAVLAATLGIFILFGVGFASSPAVHNIAHDTRHATAFPCH
jgi:cobalt transporter subunit CbtB